MLHRPLRIDLKIAEWIEGKPVGRLLLYFLEIQIPMVLGALVCYLLTLLIPSSSSITSVYHPGTFLFMTGDILFLTVPVVVWMLWRGHGWRCSLEMGIAMLTPVIAIILVGQLTGTAYLLWLITAMYPAMSLGMLIDTFYRRHEFAQIVKYSKQVTILEEESSSHAV